jgi:hypothetical protein
VTRSLPELWRMVGILHCLELGFPGADWCIGTMVTKEDVAGIKKPVTFACVGRFLHCKAARRKLIEGCRERRLLPRRRPR